MNIYLCSTVRHLLFSLLKGLSQPDQKQIIFMICDQQNIDENGFDKTHLPENIKVICIKREMIKKKLCKGLLGNCIKILANCKMQLPSYLQHKFALLLFNKTLGLTLSNTQISSSQLFLFNDRNKLSRLFRLAFSKYNVLEEGLANYSGIKFKKIETIFSFFNVNKNKMRYFGDDKRCESIYLTDPDKAPSEIRFKTREIYFIKTKNINKYCLPFFKIIDEHNYDLVLATQPLEHTGVDMKIYKKIIAICLNKNISIAIKPHPKENISRYQQELPHVPLVESKLPLDLIIFRCPKKTPIISIYSTVGIGFEKYCNRYNIIEDQDSTQEKIQELLAQWQLNIDSVDQRINELIDSIELNH